MIHQDRFRDYFSDTNKSYDILVFKILKSHNVSSKIDIGFCDPKNEKLHDSKTFQLLLDSHYKTKLYEEESLTRRGYNIDQNFMSSDDFVILHSNQGYFVSNVEEEFERTVMVLRIQTNREEPSWVRDAEV